MEVPVQRSHVSTVLAGICGGVAMNLSMAATFLLIGFGISADGILMDPAVQSGKLTAVWTKLEPLPLVTSKPAPIIVGMFLFCIILAYIYRWISPAWKPGYLRRGLSFSLILFLMTFLFWEFFTPFNLFGEPLQLIAVELGFWAVIALSTGMAIALEMELDRFRLADLAWGVPPDVKDLIGELAGGLQKVLGRSLTGACLYGSVVRGPFCAIKSDINCVVVTNGEITDAQFQRLEQWFGRAGESIPWVKRLNLVFIPKEYIALDLIALTGRELVGDERELRVSSHEKARKSNPNVRPLKELYKPNGNTLRPREIGNCAFQHGKLTRTGPIANPIVWLDITGCDGVLIGYRPGGLTPPIMPDILRACLVQGLGYLRDELIANPTSPSRDNPEYRAYAVLTICRILYTHEHGSITSKHKAAQWAIQHLPQQWHAVIKAAHDQGVALSPGEVTLAEAVGLLEHAEGEVGG